MSECTCPIEGWTETSCTAHSHQPFGSLLAEIESTEEGRTGMVVARAELFLASKILAVIEAQESWEFHDEPWIRLEPTIKAIREVTG